MFASFIGRSALQHEAVRFRHSIARAVETLAPRFVLTFGIEPLTNLPSDCRQFAVDRPVSEQSAETVSFEAYFARDLHSTHAVSAKWRPWYFDLAVIGPEYRLSERRRIIALLQSTAHRRSVALLMRHPTYRPMRSVGDAAAGIAAAFDRLDFAPILAPQPALLIGALDRAVPATAKVGASVRDGLGETVSFLHRHRIDRAGLSTAPAAIPDAPGHPGGTIEPRCRSIVDDGRLPSRPGRRDPRAITRWWDRKLALIETSVRTAPDVGFIPADGANRSLLIDRSGVPLPMSFRYEGGYGDDPAAALLQLGPACVHAADGPRHPIQEARSMLSGERRSGSFYLLGYMDPRFGHFLVESLSTAWAVEWALAQDMRFLLWGRLKPYQRMAFSLLGISDDWIVVAEPGATYERLAMPEPGFRMLGSVSPIVARSWRRIALAALSQRQEAAGAAPFVYLSRRNIPNRPLVNEAELEAFLASRGGTIIAPETLPFDDQVRAVARASAVVGCFGSQLHLSMFQLPEARKLVIGTEQFLGPEEALISVANGTVADHYIEAGDPKRGAGARAQPWAIDLRRFEPAFDRWLAAAG